MIMTTALSDEAITAGLAELAGWERQGDKISKTFKLDTYLAGLALATAIGTVCEGLDHHPDMLIGWRKVEVSLTTHDAGHKISQKDLDAAAKIEALGYPR
jgi:4a-hydroxytetrahydrobiopterin dehydratase